MAKQSAGILVYREKEGEFEVFLIHPGGPFWKNKDEGAWSIPKGKIDEGEDPLDAAKREFEEETSFQPPATGYQGIGETKLKSGKVIHAWAVEGDFNPADVQSAKIEIEWPPRSGKKREFPEIDRAEWFSLAEARRKLNPAQVDFIDVLEKL